MILRFAARAFIFSFLLLILFCHLTTFPPCWLYHQSLLVVIVNWIVDLIEVLLLMMVPNDDFVHSWYFISLDSYLGQLVG